MTDEQYEALQALIIGLQEQVEVLVTYIGQCGVKTPEEAMSMAYPHCSFPKKPDTQLIEEILEQFGPLHVSDIVVYGGQRGVSFAGGKPPSQIASDKLHGSKRFVLLGNNVWALPSQADADLTRNEVRTQHAVHSATKRVIRRPCKQAQTATIRKGRMNAHSKRLVAS